ncbi:MAG: hypothetical protein K6B41_09230 [Butyrivibrio sp.]|nr:hypothetical protein [Butyrivibrio sp.]
MEDLDAHEDGQTFILKIEHRQNASWQGELTWTDRKESMKFRSELELLRMIESAYEEEYSDVEQASS